MSGFKSQRLMEAKFQYQFERATTTYVNNNHQETERRPRDNIQIMETFQSRSIRDS